MKLNIIQITLIHAALSEHAALCHSRAYRATGTNKAFWEDEAIEVERLEVAFKDALSVEVESVHLEPAQPLN